MQPIRVRYTKAGDGIDIAYYVVGRGPPVVLLMANPASHLTAELRLPALADFYESMSAAFTIVRLDYRGSGLSGRHVDEISAETVVRDIESVMDSIGLQSAAFWGWGYGAMNALTFAARRPGRVTRLVMAETSTGGDGLNRSIARLREFDPDVQIQTRANVNTGWSDPANASAMAELIKMAIEPRELALFWGGLLFASGSTFSASMIQFPVLLVHAAHDPLFPLTEAKKLAALFPDASLHVIESYSSIAPFQDAQAIAVTKAFLRDETSISAIGRRWPAAATPASLSAREIEVLGLIALGKTNDEIARELFISASTVSHHVSNILAKSGASNRTEAAAFAYREHLVSRE